MQLLQAPVRFEPRVQVAVVVAACVTVAPIPDDAGVRAHAREVSIVFGPDIRLAAGGSECDVFTTAEGFTALLLAPWPRTRITRSNSGGQTPL